MSTWIWQRHPTRRSASRRESPRGARIALSAQGGRVGLDNRGAKVNSVHVAPSRPDDTRTRLLTHAREIYLDVGVTQFSLREVARRAGVSAAAVYRHFDNKDALLLAVCAQGFGTFAAYLMRALVAKTPRERLLASAAEYCNFALENVQDYRVIFMADLTGVMADNDAADATETPTFRFLCDRVDECIAARVLARGDTVAIAATIWAHVHGLVALRVSGHLRMAGTDREFRKFFTKSVQALLTGLST